MKRKFLFQAKRTKEPADDPRKNCAAMDASRNHFLVATNCDQQIRFICEGPITKRPPIIGPPKNPNFFPEKPEKRR